MNVFAVVLCHKLEQWVDRAVASVTTQIRRPAGILLVGTDARWATSNAFAKWITWGDAKIVMSETRLSVWESKRFAERMLRQVFKVGPTDAFFILDADDEIHERYIEKCAMTMKETGCAVVGCDYEIMDELGHRLPAFSNSKSVYDLRSANPLPSVSIVRMDAYESVKGYTNEGGGFEDWTLWMRIAAAGYRIARYPQKLFCYHRHASNVTNSYDGDAETVKARALFDRLNKNPAC